jgi:REP-associated tyrosine transposase
VFCPKYRYRIFDGQVGEYAKQQVYQLARQKDLVEVEELNVQPDHVHAILSVPPKYAISDMMGFLKGKMALNLFHRYQKLGKQYWGRHLWSRGYCVSTIGLDEDQIRKYVRWQENNDNRAEQSPTTPIGRGLMKTPRRGLKASQLLQITIQYSGRSLSS